MSDPRLANTGANVLGREIIDDTVLIASFEKLLESGEEAERVMVAGKDPTEGMGIVDVLEQIDVLLKFIDRHGRQLLELARKGAGLS